MSQYNVIDLKVLLAFAKKKNALIEKYNAINRKYDKTVETLTSKWQGEGAKAFKSDAKNIKTNLIALKDVLSTLCDTISDSVTAFDECDVALGESNKNAVNN